MYTVTKKTLLNKTGNSNCSPYNIKCAGNTSTASRCACRSPCCPWQMANTRGEYCSAVNGTKIRFIWRVEDRYGVDRLDTEWRTAFVYVHWSADCIPLSLYTMFSNMLTCVPFTLCSPICWHMFRTHTVIMWFLFFLQNIIIYYYYYYTNIYVAPLQ